MSSCIHAIRRGLLAIAGLFCAALSIAATPQANTPIHAPQNPAIASAVGKSFTPVKPGVLTVAIAPFAPPIATFAADTKTVIGFDPDYARLIAETLGLKLDLQVVAWADWPLGLSSGKYDAVISNVGVTEQRKEKFDFATYRLGLHGFYVRKNSPIQSIRQPHDIAGLRIITSSGTIQEKILLEWNKQNITKGLKPIELQYYEDQNAINLALLTGRADAVLNPNSPLAWLARKEGKLRACSRSCCLAG